MFSNELIFSAMKALFSLFVSRILFIGSMLLSSCISTPPPEPLEPLPSSRQLDWHLLEFYAFVHFNMNTFTDMEWGTGAESPSQFNPTELDCRQWARVCRDAGMKGIILTVKHHDGFCLWPSAFTEHSVKNSPWKDGQGDVVRELAEACREYGLKMGIYLSPWDRNHADYGRPEYLDYFRNQLMEVLTNYGEVFEVWFDGANGGSGYYGGANETRRIDGRTYYDWDSTRNLVRHLQPDAVMFSDAGPDVRWVGNEQGWAGETNWCLLRKEEFYPGSQNYRELGSGHEDGTHWVPAEVDVSIRPGWYYHPVEDDKVKTLPELLDIYYHSVGRNASLLLNFPVDPRGLIHENDAEQVARLAAQLRLDFADDLASGARVEASNTRGGSRQYAASKLIDGDAASYWAADDGVVEVSITLDFGRETEFNRFLAQEHIPLGQRIRKFRLEALVEGDWEHIADGTTIGYKRILRFETVNASSLRLLIEDSRACPILSAIGVYLAPDLPDEAR